MLMLDSTLAALDLAQPQRRGMLGLIPLCLRAPAPTDAEPEPYTLFTDALRAATLEITEVSDTGSVPELAAVNRGDRDVLLVDGEELLGAKQNRMVNLSILIPARRAIRIPVSCVEAGRWHHRTTATEFAPSPHTVHARARAEKTRQVSASLREGRRDADQMAVWAEIDRKAAALNVCTETRALSDVYASVADRVDGAVGGFEALPRQVGAIFTVGGAVAGAELFDRPRTFATYLPKLVRGYALDALELEPVRATRISRRAGATFLRRVARARWQGYPALGTGEDFRFDDEGVAGGALVAEGRVVHLTALCVG